MSNEGLYIMAGLAKGFEKGVDNYSKIKQKQAELKQENEEWKLNKKVKEAQLKVYEAKTSPEAMEQQRKEFQQTNQLFELNQKAKASAINTAEIKVQKELMDLERTKTIYQAAELNTLQSEGKTEGEARAIMAMEQGRSANIAGQQVPVASPEFTEQYSDFGSAETNVATGEREAYGTRGSTRDPFLTALSRGAQERTGLTKTEAREKIYGDDEKTITQAKRGVVGDIRAAKSKNKPIEDINKLIRFEGYEPEEFAEELEGYNPIDKATLIEKAKSFIPGVEGQKRDRRMKDGIPYEKRDDGLWHKVESK